MYPNFNNYDKYPEIGVKGFGKGSSAAGWDNINQMIRSRVEGKERAVITLEIYPGAREEEILSGLFEVCDCAFAAEECMISKEEYREKIQPSLTDDRVFGYMSDAELSEFYDGGKIREMRKRIDGITSGVILVYGTGASLIADGDLLIYADLARWEIQTRYKAGAANFHSDNGDAPFLSKYKQGFFLEWRYADRLKVSLFEKIDVLLDTNTEGEPKAVTGEAFREGLSQASRRPFRLVPYFDPGVWGGQWMKTVCDLPRDRENFAWSFDGVPEENSLYLRIDGVRIEIPAIDLVLYRPKELLGERVYDRFGAEFPIRFDFLDTMGGQNLSLQVHPLTSYIQKTFGMKYTQDESYYILDCEDDACVYLGLKTGINKDDMLSDLRAAQAGGAPFPAEKYVNKFPAKKHDHFLIPAGTVHCSGANSMVLEISATPYIFTFKLWDWGRLGLDGLPRPIHIDHGEKVIQWDRTTEWVKNNLVGQNCVISDGEVKEEHTGLHPLEFIETRRHTFGGDIAAMHNTNGSVHVLNLVEGEEAEVFSPDGAFEPFTVHYAETFVIPESVGEYGIRATGKSKDQKLMTIQASVRE